MTRPSFLDRNVPEPSTTPVLFAEGHEIAALQGVIAERDAAVAKIADLEQALASTEGELHRAMARADEAIEQIGPLHDALTKAEAQIAELTKPEEPTDDPSPKRKKGS